MKKKIPFERSLASHEKSKYFNITKNKIKPKHINKWSKDKYWFTCDKCLHEFLTSPDYIMSGSNPKNDFYKMTQAIKNGYSIIHIYQPDVFNDTIDWQDEIKEHIAYQESSDIALIASDLSIYDDYYAYIYPKNKKKLNKYIYIIVIIMNKAPQSPQFIIYEKNIYSCDKCGCKIKSNRYYDAIVKYHLCKDCITTSAK